MTYRSGYSNSGYSNSGRKAATETMGSPSEWSACALEGGCLSLERILRSFSAPISEEHAWAVIHQSLVCLSRLLVSLEKDFVHLVTSTKHIFLRADGSVDVRTFNSSGEKRYKASSENKAVAELGVVIFNALDFGLKDHEERQLSPALENIIDLMTSADCEEEKEDQHGDTDDEGIGRDEEENTGCSSQWTGKQGVCLKLIHLCRNHLALPSEAEMHFKAVCRALVSEALELSSFMEKVSLSKRNVETDSELGELCLQDWARLWVQVIHELRSGLKLKKIDYTKTPIEYELTPYEILMDDIRSRRYKLNKVSVEERVPPRVKKDAHDIILDFIRSRPPLKPVGDRKLVRGPRKQSTPLELLMESIRSEQTRKSLRKTTGPPMRPLLITSVESSRCKLDDWQPSPAPTRRVIKPDQDLMDSLLNFSGDDEDDDEDTDGGEKDVQEEQGENQEKQGEEKERKRNWRNKVALDLILHGPRLTLQRRHSVTVCQTPGRQASLDVHATSAPRTKPQTKQLSLDLREGRKMGVASRQKISVDLDQLSPVSVVSTTSSSLSSVYPNEVAGSPSPPLEGRRSLQEEQQGYSINTPQMHANLHSEFIKSEQWMDALQTLELSLEEVVHIRSVLSRAELDALPLDNNLKENVQKGKVCFLCMRSWFSLFHWGVRCELCRQQVCAKCSSRMRIPLEHFSSVPVFALAPQSPTPDTPTSTNSTFKERISSLAPDLSFFSSGAGSAPTSPLTRRRTVDEGRSSASTLGRGERGHSVAAGQPASLTRGDLSIVGRNEPTSLPVFTSQGTYVLSARFGELKRALSREIPRSRLETVQGTLLSVCTDCKEMVLQVVRSQKTAKRLQMTRSLYQKLSPGYKQEIY